MTDIDAGSGISERLRVAVYVFGTDRDDQLLVFDHVDHPDAGVQIPAGGVDPGETLDAAVRREALEECGVQDLDQLRAIGVRRSPQSEVMRLTIYFVARATLDDLPRVHRVSAGDQDQGLLFRCRWAPVDEVELLDDQGGFLALARTALH
ncbi:MAG TPA: NUDIX domain-containing protein [Microlunatus sp.]